MTIEKVKVQCEKMIVSIKELLSQSKKSQYIVLFIEITTLQIQNIVYNININNNIKDNLYFKKHAGNLESEVEALKTTDRHRSVNAYHLT